MATDLRVSVVFLHKGARWRCLLISNTMSFEVFVVKYQSTALDFHCPRIFMSSRDIPTVIAVLAAPLQKE